MTKLPALATWYCQKRINVGRPCPKTHRSFTKKRRIVPVSAVTNEASTKDIRHLSFSRYRTPRLHAMNTIPTIHHRAMERQGKGTAGLADPSGSEGMFADPADEDIQKRMRDRQEILPVQSGLSSALFLVAGGYGNFNKGCAFVEQTGDQLRLKSETE